MDWIADVQVRTFAAATTPIARLPGAVTSLVLCTAHGRDAALVAGPALRASYKRAEDVPLYVRVALAPGAARAAFGVPVSELTDRAVALDAITGWEPHARRLRAELHRTRATGDPIRLVALVRSILAARLARSPVDRARAATLARALALLDSGAEVSSLAPALGTSERYLRALFHAELGLAPKRYARIARVRRTLAVAGTRSWGELAAAHGFADQAHLAGEFRALLGAAPTAFAAGRVPVIAGCQRT